MTYILKLILGVPVHEFNPGQFSQSMESDSGKSWSEYEECGFNLRIAPYNSFCRRWWDTVRPYGYGKNTFFCSAEAYFSRAGAIN